MWTYITALIFGLCLLWGLVHYARKESSNAARLDALKREIKVRQRAQTINDNVRRMSIDSVRDKLQQTK